MTHEHKQNKQNKQLTDEDQVNAYIEILEKEQKQKTNNKNKKSLQDIALIFNTLTSLRQTPIQQKTIRHLQLRQTPIQQRIIRQLYFNRYSAQFAKAGKNEEILEKQQQLERNQSYKEGDIKIKQEFNIIKKIINDNVSNTNAKEQIRKLGIHEMKIMDVLKTMHELKKIMKNYTIDDIKFYDIYKKLHYGENIEVIRSQLEQKRAQQIVSSQPESHNVAVNNPNMSHKKTMNRLQIQREIILKREANEQAAKKDESLKSILLITGTIIIGIITAVLAFTTPLFKSGFRNMTETEISPVSVMTIVLFILVVLIKFK